MAVRDEQAVWDGRFKFQEEQMKVASRGWLERSGQKLEDSEE